MTNGYIDDGYIDDGYFEEVVPSEDVSAGRLVEVPAVGRAVEVPGSTRVADAVLLSMMAEVSGGGSAFSILDEARTASPIVGNLRVATPILGIVQVAVSVVKSGYLVSVKKGENMALSWTEVFDPHEVKDYSVDFSELLDEVSDSISAAAWTLSASAIANGLVKDSDAIQNNKRVCVIWLSCTPGKEQDLINGSPYNLDLLVTTVGTRKFNETIELTVESK